MKKITLEEYLKQAEADAALTARLRGCADPKTAMELVAAAAAEQGYELTGAEYPEKAVLSDDDLGAVSGGVNPFIPLGEGELNPYSWFVTLLRRLMGLGDDTSTQTGPEQQTPEDSGR